ncbi:hypothetical protein [Brucella pituitosa]|uniref:hypothetical protein n=1 Tax=Brucella pituitosa TaxID=571256 RepID=UPI003F4A87DF
MVQLDIGGVKIGFGRLAAERLEKLTIVFSKQPYIAGCILFDEFHKCGIRKIKQVVRPMALYANLA